MYSDVGVAKFTQQLLPHRNHCYLLCLLAINPAKRAQVTCGAAPLTLEHAHGAKRFSDTTLG